MIALDAPLDPRIESKLTRWFSRIGVLKKMAVLTGFLVTATGVDAKIIYVNGAVETTAGSGASWATAYKYLRDALNNSLPTDQIYVAKGTYFPDDDRLNGNLFGNRLIAFELVGQAIYGGFAGTETSLSQRDTALNPTILSGEIWLGLDSDIRFSSMHVIVMSENSTLDGVTVEGGNANGTEWWAYPAPEFFNQGAGCYVSSGKTLKLQGCIFRNNRAFSSGGGIKVQDSTGLVDATDCLFQQNQVPRYASFTPEDAAGGAIGGNVKATNCKFITNSVSVIDGIGGGNCSAEGGAIFGNVTATGCEFTDNTVTAQLSSEGDNGLASGGAISGSVQALGCNFSGNKSVAPLPDKGVAAGGAINGGTVNAVNCTFAANTTTTGKINPNGSGEGGGGALLTKSGDSTLVNCVFVKNTSGVRGGAIHAGTAVNSGSAPPDSLVISNCTFLDNGVATGFKGAALSCGGQVRIMNNVFWSTAATAGTFTQDNLVQVIIGGLLRNTDLNYPTPSTVAQNVVKGGLPGVINGSGGDMNLGNPLATIVVGAPLFFNAADPDGLDNRWRTADDGLRLTAGSSAIGTVRNPLIPTYRSFLATDALDVDSDGNTSELIQADIASFARVQNVLVPLPPALAVATPLLDMGAYEYGDVLHAPDISVEYPAATVLVDGAATAVDFSALAGVTTTFVIKNLGTLLLSKLAITGDGVDIGSFKITQPASTTVPVGSSTTFTVTFRPTATGMRNAKIHIASNDPDESPFDITLKGNSPLPDIAVETPVGTGLVDGTSVVDFGAVGETLTLTKTFTLRNSGLGNLGIFGISSSGNNVENFTVTTPGSALLLPGETTTFNVTFSPSGIGNRSASIVIDNSDPNNGSFLISLAGSGVGIPEIVVSEPFGRELVTGNKSNFGSVGVTLLHSKTFVVKNTGSATLNNISVNLSGSGKFTKTKIGVTSLKPGAQAKFSVTFKPTAVGKLSATLVISSNDANESQIVLNLMGTGVSKSSSGSSSRLTAASKALTNSQRGVNVALTRDSEGLKYLVLTVEKSEVPKLAIRNVEVSSNLTRWFSGPNHTTTLLDNDSVLRVRDDTPVKEGEKRYIRLK